VPTLERNSFRFLPPFLTAGALPLIDKIALVFVRLKFTPNMLTVLGLLAGLAAGLLFGLARPLGACLALLLSGVLDVIDGLVAAKTNTKSRYGAILDSTLDRYSESFLYMGLAFHFRTHWALWLAVLAFLGSMMVSYTRARAEGLGFECKIGLMQRAERLTLLGLAALLSTIFPIFDAAMIAALGLIALFSNITALQRTMSVRSAEQHIMKKKDVRNE